MILEGELPRLIGVQCATGEKQRNSSRKRAGPKWKHCWIVYVSGGESKVWCCKEQYCIGTLNVRSMNQGKLDMVKQEMARVNINILGISEVKWTGMGKFNSHDHYIYYCGQVSLRRNGVALIVNKSLKCSTWMQSQKQQNDLCSFPSKPFNITVFQVCSPTTNAEEAEVDWFYEDIQYLLELTSKKLSSSSQGIKMKSRKSRDTWDNRQVWPWSTKWSKAKANRVLSRKHTGHSKHPLPTTQEMILHMDITRYQIDYILYSQRWRSSIQSAKIRLGADCGSDHELLINKFRLKLKKVGKTTRPFRYDLNQIPCDYTMEVTDSRG